MSLGSTPARRSTICFRLAYRSRQRPGEDLQGDECERGRARRGWRDPKNRKCDAPGSWLCTGQYPPAKEIQEMLARRIDYGQLEDFNRGKRDDAYYRAYMRPLPAMKGVARGLGKVCAGAQIRFKIRVCARQGPLCLVAVPRTICLTQPYFYFGVRALQ
ncbi:putative oligosaccharyl transferase subunit [Trypanosoma cruzi]|uniref:Putative oligosaccharyl transferase subunit n=1 Tax=Trypanosoma cruzi TaxID=5693 RepID=A0A2V2WQF6_TRYCR|nr:putative oligosaccharyl transferase subunit [Trypanosoma cruzi]